MEQVSDYSFNKCWKVQHLGGQAGEKETGRRGGLEGKYQKNSEREIINC